MRLGQLSGLTLLLLLGCGSSDNAGDESATASPSSQEPEGTSAVITSEAMARCAGFTAEDAAAILGVSATEVEDRSRDETETIRMCTYALRSDAFTVVAFNLSLRESVEAAISEMQYNREMMGMAQTSIEGVIGEASGDRPYEEVEGVGDEAFWSPLHGALQMRVGHVFVQVTMPNSLEKQKAVAQKVAEGLVR